MKWNTHWQTNITMENGPFEDASPIKKGGFPFLCWFTRGYQRLK